MLISIVKINETNEIKNEKNKGISNNEKKIAEVLILFQQMKNKINIFDYLDDKEMNNFIVLEFFLF